MFNLHSLFIAALVCLCFNGTCLAPATGGLANRVFSAVQLIMASQCLIHEGIIEDVYVTNPSTFDFIIVGAGTSGCVLANRLSETKSWRILLIEAGDDPPVEAAVPGLDKSIIGTKSDWKYLTTNDGRINQANIGGSINWPRGKMIGGSSNINAMIYIKGNKHNYQNWREAGNIEWSNKEVQRCFRKAENYQNMYLSKRSKIYEEYGHRGPLVINTFNSTYREITEKVLSAWESIGIRRVTDLNAANLLGAGIMAATAANGERQSSSRAYLNSAKHRKQLTILKNTLVTKILINKETKVAYGVKARRGSQEYQYFAAKEVIISAGAINSPQLLMLSGIGPKDHLISKNVEVLVDSPMVGQNLQDHCIIPIMVSTNETKPETTYDQNFDVLKYIYNRTGYLAHNSFADILAFYSSDKSAVRPLYQSHLSIIWKNTSNFKDIMTNQFRYKDIVATPIVELNKNYTIFMFLFNLLHPYSRGNVSLQSEDPEQHPLIYPNYFKQEVDLKSAVKGIKMLTKVLHTEYFRSIGGFLARMEWPECNVHELDTKKYWACVCINMVLTVYHPVGTCKMGSDPETSVVDSRLKVHKVRNLRVIDASIMPNITSGNTNGPVTMIGERGAELIKEDYYE